MIISATNLLLKDTNPGNNIIMNITKSLFRMSEERRNITPAKVQA